MTRTIILSEFPKGNKGRSEGRSEATVPTNTQILRNLNFETLEKVSEPTKLDAIMDIGKNISRK